MTIDARLNTLDQRHKDLEDRIEEEMRRPSYDDLHLHELKRQKLALKDEMSALEAQRNSV